MLALVSITAAPRQDASAATFTSGGYTTNASAPSPVAPGSTVTVTLSVTSAQASTALVDAEIYAPDGTKVHQAVFDNQSFSAGQQRSYAIPWTLPAGAAGTYTVRSGIFSLGWGTLYHWNANAVSFAAGTGATATATPVGATATPTAPAGGLPSLPAGWPSGVQLGTFDSPGGAGAMKATAPFGFRYQYLAGGVNTGGGWANWNPNGGFATNYIQESIGQGMTPVFTYYMLYQSAPGNTQGEADSLYTNLQNSSTMAAYYNDLKLLFQRSGAFGGSKVVVHVEPDLWGYLQQRSTGDNAATVPAKVGSSGLPELAGLPDNISGFARAIDKLRDTYAPNVVLAYHMSVWGTGNDIVYTNPSDASVDALATRAGAFFTSLQGGFDVAFAEFSDRDAGFKQYQYGDGGAAWWDSGDFARNLRFLKRFVAVSQKRVVMWQIPQGNTRMLAMNNTWNHYQNNHFEWLFDEPSRAHLQDYTNAGVVGYLFGRGADGATCDCDANGDGVTNPAPINGNTGVSLSSDDDGGFFDQKVKAYYATGVMALPGGGAPIPTATPTRTATPAVATATPTRTPTAPAATATRTRTATPNAATATPTRTPTAPAPTATVMPGGVSARASVAPSSVFRNTPITINTDATSAQKQRAHIIIEIYAPNGTRAFQQSSTVLTFTAGSTRAVAFSWTPSGTAAQGTYTVRIRVVRAGSGGPLLYQNVAAATFTVN